MFDEKCNKKILSAEIFNLARAFEGTEESASIYGRLGRFFQENDLPTCAVIAFSEAVKRGNTSSEIKAFLKKVKSSPFYEKTFVITGVLSKMEREEALLEIRKYGGLTSDNPVSRMDYLVLGYQEWSELNGGVASRKVTKAMELQKKGKDVKIISADELYAMLENASGQENG